MDEVAIRYLDLVKPDFTTVQAAQIAHRIFGLDGEFTSLSSERDLNYRVNGKDGRACIFKISIADEDEPLVDMQIKAMMHIAEQDPDLPIPRVIKTVDGKPYDWCEAADGARHMVRALTIVPGVNIDEVDRSHVLLEDVGAVTARSSLALRGFFHPSASYDLLWDIRIIEDLLPFLIHIEDGALRRILSDDLDSTIRHILPRLSSMRTQVIHNDANVYNLLCDPADPDHITGLVDFGDMMFAPLVQDLGVAAGSMTNSSNDPVADICHVTMGYDRVVPLEDDEINIVSQLALTRMAQETLISLKRSAENTHISDYLGGGAEGYLQSMDRIMSVGHDEIRRQIRKACRFPVYCPAFPTSDQNAQHDKEVLLKRRRKSLGPELELSYEDPMHVVRSQGVWVYDASGKPHLDAYNNVPHVGHCHPHVVRAVTRQLAAMNSNTRYLYENVVEYAERLAATMPGDLSSAIFVNSGSEANDAALQIAKAITGNTGAIIVESAYHGITETIMGLSPSIQYTDNPVLPEDVRTIAAPNNSDQDYLESVDLALASLAAAGKAPAAFMVDCSLSSNGITDIPKEYLPAIVDKIRAAGGLIIADEVQIGFGRSGTHMWGIEAQGVVPDIITLGKPMGNGIAIGAVVMTPNIHHRFTNQVDFFSTFGGNPVACSAANAVLDVMERENLMDNANVCGEYLRNGIRKLGNRYPVIGSVNGQGLFNGVEIVQSDGSGAPDVAMTNAIVNGMRNNGVLISTAHATSLKIRPPMVFQTEHVDILINTFDKVLGELCP